MSVFRRSRYSIPYTLNPTPSSLCLEILQELTLAGFFEMNKHGISAARRYFFANYGANVIPVLMKNGFAERINAAGGIGGAFRGGERRMRPRLFAHEGGQVHEHRIVALGAADPQILRRWFFGKAVDGLRFFASQARAGLANDFLAGCTGTLGAEHESGNVLGAPPRAGLGWFCRSFRRQCQGYSI